MIRATLKECIDLFNSNAIMQCTAIRGMEQLGEWQTASKYWLKLGRIVDSKACDMIVQATEKGDSYRASTKHLNDWVEETVSQDIMTKEEAIKVIYPELNRIYKQHFCN